MKFLFVLALLAFLFALVYRRVRPYVTAARRFHNVFRDAQRLASDDQETAAPRRQSTRAGEKLSRCSICGTWLPASRALTLRNSPDLYCSHACLERAAAGEPAKKRPREAS
jgi:hypothetical protein